MSTNAQQGYEFPLGINISKYKVNVLFAFEDMENIASLK
jgi:hypothetical protein